MDADAARGRVLLEESRESVVVLDDDDRVLAREPARAPVDPGARGGREAPRRPPLGRGRDRPARRPLRRRRAPRAARLPRERRRPDRLRGAARRASRPRSRTSCARRSRGCCRCSRPRRCPARTCADLVDRARAEVEQIRELIDEVLFLSELESGTRVVSLGAVAVRPELEAVVAELEERASRAGVALVVEGDPEIELAIRPRMLRVVAQNLAENAIRYAGPGATFTLAVERDGGRGRPARHRRRGRGRGGAAAAALRALLPRRPRARLARHRARARDREAHRHAGRRHGRGARRPGRGPRDPLRVPGRSSRPRSPVSHQMFTARVSPRDPPAAETTRSPMVARGAARGAEGRHARLPCAARSVHDHRRRRRSGSTSRGPATRRARWGDWTLFGLSGGATLLTLVTFGLIVWKIVDQASPSVGKFGLGFLTGRHLERGQRRVRRAGLHLRDGDHVALRAPDRDADRDRDRALPLRPGAEVAALARRRDDRDAGRRPERPDRALGDHRARPDRPRRHRAGARLGARLDALLRRAGVRLHGREPARRP